MIDSLLIANRGEIACRIERTCRRLGIRSIAVYSDADISARHVREADEAIRIGASEATRSYLNADAMIQAALESGAAAIHPGFGFLSEKTVLPELCVQHGLIWVGPRADVIAAMGSKIEAKRIAEAAQVSIVPGYHGENQQPAFLLAMAQELGFPLLIKASAGGGGKGMRRVDGPVQFIPQLAAAMEEARRAFGDDRVLLEKLIARPRHLEVQLAGDQHGNLVHLFERECSIQRNYQKVIEEAPAAHLPQAVREQLFEQALRLGHRIGYDSIGTVEFVLDEGSDTPYFLEMNTRLQVEHPVTEQITGIDLIELQLRIASGEPLPYLQNDLQMHGWAIEARINCEDPARQYQPQIGQVVRYHAPDIPGVRVDSGIDIGSSISTYYDSMIAKVIGFGPTRLSAARRLDRGLSQFEAVGIGTNQAFLRSVLARPAFHTTALTTLFLAEQFVDGWQRPSRLTALAIVAAAWQMLTPAELSGDSIASPWQRRRGFRNMEAAGRMGAARITVQLDLAGPVAVTLAPDGATWRCTVDDLELSLQIDRIDAQTLQIADGGDGPAIFSFCVAAGVQTVSIHGMRWNTAAVSTLRSMAQENAYQSTGRGQIRSPMPGLITAVHVEVGQTVLAGQVSVVMEAMKLIHTLCAEIDGTVQGVHCFTGDSVGAGIVLIDIVPTETAAQAS